MGFLEGKSVMLVVFCKVFKKSINLKNRDVYFLYFSFTKKMP